MTPFLLWYGHTPAGAPQRVVLGLALVRRAVLSAQAAGFRRIVVAVRETDRLAVRAGLLGDRRIRADLTVLEVPERPSAAVEHVLPGDGDEVVVALGDRVWDPAVLAGLAEPLASARVARLLCADPAGGVRLEPSGLARVRADRLDRLPLVHGLDPDDAAEALGGREGVELRTVRPCWLPVHQADGVPAAEALLLGSLAGPDERHAEELRRALTLSWIRRFARHSAAPAVLRVAALLFGLVSGPLAWSGRWSGFVLAGLALLVSWVLRGCARDVERLRYLASPRRAWADVLVGDAGALSLLGGVFLFLERGEGRPGWSAIALAALCVWASAIPMRYRLLAARLRRRGPVSL